MIRLIIIIVILVYHREIYNFLVDKKLNNFEGIKHNIKKKQKVLKKFIYSENLNNALLLVKKIDKRTYKQCKIILKNIERISDNFTNNIQQNKLLKTTFYKNEFENLKFERKRLLNLIASLVVNKGFHDKHNFILEEFKNYIEKLMNDMMNLAKETNRKNRSFHKNINYFDPRYELVEPFDSKINYNYDVF